MKNTLTRIVTAAALIAGMSSAVHAADSPDAFLKLLADARTQSSELSLGWKSCAKKPAGNWSANSPEVTVMKDQLTAIAGTIAALNEMRAQAPFAQLAAIDRIVPVVQEIADNSTKAIDFLARNQTRLTERQYKDYVEQSSDTSGRLATLVSQLVDYQSRRAKFDLAKRNLELAAK
jgi:hypothetical protein